GRLRFELNDYAAARKLFLEALGDGSSKDSAQIRIYLGRLYGRLGQFDAARSYLSLAADDVKRNGESGLFPSLYDATGEVAYESDRIPEARASFGEAAALWINDLPDEASVEARAFAGLLDVLARKDAQGVKAIQTSLNKAHTM